MPAPSAIEVRDLHKRFRIPQHRVQTLKERALHPLRRTRYSELQVLEALDFDVAQGEFFGIVGRNGSGKSTLLKCLAGIYRADRGTIRVAGRLAPFIELGVGFNPDLTARENVLINAVMMGLSPREARGRFDEIIAFAELEDFLELKLKNYSSGMQVRLAFSVMVQADADVMLIDEVLAVGDAAFQQKCLDVFYRMREEGRTVVLVTHDMGTVERFCHRGMLIRDGHIDFIGDPGDVGRRYLELNFSAREGQVAPAAVGHAADVLGVRVQREDGLVTQSIPHGEEMALYLDFRVHEDVNQPCLHLWIANQDGIRVFATSTRQRLEDLAAGNVLRTRLALRNRLASGHYFVGCVLTRGASGVDVVTRNEQVADFIVFGAEQVEGMVDIEHDLSFERELDTALS
jgi:ABC-2 type transport system ATP-binding protein